MTDERFARENAYNQLEYRLAKAIAKGKGVRLDLDDCKRVYYALQAVGGGENVE